MLRALTPGAGVSRRRRVLTVASATLLGVTVIAALAARALPFDPVQFDLGQALEPPTWSRPLGNDELGRDLLTRIVYGARTSLGIAVGAVSLAAVVGAIFGVLSGFVGGRMDAVVMQAVNVTLSFPAVLLALLMVVIVGQGVANLMVAIALQALPGYVRLVRGLVLSVRANDYVEAARALGCTPMRIVGYSILPNVLAPMAVQSTFMLAASVQLTAGLSFLGIGVPPPTPEWGAILAGGRNYLSLAPHITLAPGLVLLVVLLALNFLGDTLRDALDPRVRL
jgi:peptide/nickel transport system permease protein/oligopeptide transport system permease protein